MLVYKKLSYYRINPLAVLLIFFNLMHNSLSFQYALIMGSIIGTWIMKAEKLNANGFALSEVLLLL